jgi:hypothetical protein
MTLHRNLLLPIVLILPVPLGCEKPDNHAPPQTHISGPTNAEANAASQTSSANSQNRTAAAATSAPPVSQSSTATTTQVSAEERLHGTWIANDVDVAMGNVKIKLTFKDEGPVKLAAWSDIPFVGQVRDIKAPYEVHGNTISSKAIRGGTSVKYHFEGDDLIIQYQDGKTVRFKRQA